MLCRQAYTNAYTVGSQLGSRIRKTLVICHRLHVNKDNDKNLGELIPNHFPCEIPTQGTIRKYRPIVARIIPGERETENITLPNIPK